MTVYDYLLIFAIFCFVCSLFVVTFSKKKNRFCGNLIVVNDPIDGDYIFLESNVSIDEIKKMTDVSFRVVTKTTSRDKQRL